MVSIFDAEVDIDDRLRREPGYRCRTDVIDAYRPGPEGGDDLRLLYRETVRPSRVWRDDLDFPLLHSADQLHGRDPIDRHDYDTQQR